MLIKKILEDIPPLKFPKIPMKERRRCLYVASAELYDLTKCGSVLTVDIFDAKSRELKLRFFSDGAKYLVCSDWTAKEKSWCKRNPTA